MNTLKQETFDDLCVAVKNCTACPRMANSSRVLSGAIGSLNAPLMFIGEAPGRLGADETEIPFHGDKAGENFENFIQQVGINRYDIVVTNAVLCNPKDEKGNNSTPSNTELSNCSQHLKKQIEIINPSIVVTLGGFALKATNLIDPHSCELNKHVRQAFPWFGRTLIPLYHPGQRALIHRSFANQRADYQYVAERLKRLNRPLHKKTAGRTRESVAPVIDFMTSLLPHVSYFALHKIFYLAECESIKQTGARLTDAFFIRQKDGPYCTDIHIQKLRKRFPDMKTINENDQIFIVRKVPNLFDKNFESHLVQLDDKTQKILVSVLEKYGSKTNAELKTDAYMTRPMRQILKLEKEKKLNTFNIPINFESLTVKSIEAVF